MKMPDAFSTRYRDLLGGTYDCVDRIVLNAYFPLAQSGGGFRCWWRVHPVFAYLSVASAFSFVLVLVIVIEKAEEV